MINTSKTMATIKPRYRTIQECHDELLRIDSGCKISLRFIRDLCKENKIECFANGTKSIVNLDNLLAYIGFQDATPPTEQSHSNPDKPKKYAGIELGLIPCERII